MNATPKSITHLVVNSRQRWNRERLSKYSNVQKLTIDGYWNYRDDDASNIFLDLENLQEIEVINSDGRLFSENGCLYSNISRNKIRAKNKKWYGDSYSCEYASRWDEIADLIGGGKVLLAIPTAFPCNHFIVPEGTVAISSGAIDGLKQIESISFPNSIRRILFAGLDCPNLKTLFVPNKQIDFEDQPFSSKPQLVCTDTNVTLDKDVVKSWLSPWVRETSSSDAEDYKEETENDLYQFLINYCK